MNNNIIKLIIVMMIAAISFSCQKENGMSERGYLKLNIDRDESLIVVGTKSEPEPIYKVSVLDAKGAKVASYDNHNDLADNPLELKAGRYTVIASTGEDGGYAAFEKPVYQGSDEIEVVAGRTSVAEVVCTLSQVKVTVKCSEQVTDAFSKVIVTVTNHTDFTDGSRNLIYSSENGVAEDGTIGKEGYFQCTGSLKYNIYLINKNNEISNGEVFGIFSNVKAKEHYILNLTLGGDDEGGAIVPGIGVDGSTNDQEYDVMVNLNKKAKPAFSTNGFNLDNIAYVSVGSTLTWQINILAKAGIERLALSHNSTVLSGKGIPTSFNLLNLDNASKTAINNAGIAWSGVVAGTKESMTLDFSALLSSLPLGDYKFTISALDKQAQEVTEEFNFKIIPSVETSTISAEAWGRHAFLYGIYNTETQPAGMGFEYRKESESSWKKITDSLTVSGTNYSVKVKGLEPRTKYIFRTISDKEPSNEIEFTTLGADQFYNMNFEKWDGDTNPNSSGDAKKWDTSNEGAKLGGLTPTKRSTVVPTGVSSVYSVRMETGSAFGVLAAGSLYIGAFDALVGIDGAKLNFGMAYDCKPLSLKGYWNYAPATIDKTKSPYTGLKGQNDIANIYVVLADWSDGYFAVNTASNPKVLIDPENDANIIGYGSIEINQNTNGYVKFEIPIEYRNKRTPTTCVIVCSSSKYGDYFTGGVGSTLYVDEFEFTF